MMLGKKIDLIDMESVVSGGLCLIFSNILVCIVSGVLSKFCHGCWLVNWLVDWWVGQLVNWLVG